MLDYNQFLQTKEIRPESVGFTADSLNNNLFPFQKHVVDWALKKGRAAIFC